MYITSSLSEHVPDRPVAVVLLSAACRGEVQVRRFADATRPELLGLRNPDPDVAVSGRTVFGRVEIDGSADTGLMLNGAPRETGQLQGRAHFRWDGDWSADSAHFWSRSVAVQAGSPDCAAASSPSPGVAEGGGAAPA
jgi:hypothetical protein